MTEENKIIHNISKYKSIQEAVNALDSLSTLLLEGREYHESIVIDKPIHIIGHDDTVIHLDEFQMTLIGAGTVILENIKFKLDTIDRGAGLTVSESNLIVNKCDIDCNIQKRETFSFIWVESGSLTMHETEVVAQTNLIKMVDGDQLVLTNNKMKLTSGQIVLECHNVRNTKVEHNNITASCDVIRCTKCVEININHNTVDLNYSMVSKQNAVVIDGLEHGETCNITHNTMTSNKNVHIQLSNSHATGRKTKLFDNKLISSDGYYSKITLSHLQGQTELGNNVLKNGCIDIVVCSEVLLSNNEASYLNASNLNQLIAVSNQLKNHISLEKIRLVDFKKNDIKNSGEDKEAIKLSVIDKLNFEQNKLSSVDHGITLLNAGDNLEISVLKNEFSGCRKRAINIASTMQQKYLKTEVNIAGNIFIHNGKGIYIDDRNLKSCSIHENYFSDNKDAIVLLGGKSTSYMKLSGNYFDATTQRIEFRGSQICKIAHNAFSDSKLNVRGCDEIVIDGNYFSKYYYSTGKSLNSEICIKSGGSLSASHNTLLTGKKRHEKKEVIERLNITSYERQSAMNIHDNKVLHEYRKKKFFEEIEQDLALYPDESLLATLRFQIHAESNRNPNDMSIDEVMTSDLYKLQDEFNKIKERVYSKEIKEALSELLNGFNIEIFAGHDSNDIYRFMAKTNETVEMLKIYLSMEVETDVSTEKRVITVLGNYKVVLHQMTFTQAENEQDKLNAQLKLLENLL